MVTICTYIARTLASESSIEDLLMQARMIRYDVIGLAETRRRYPFNTVYVTGEELFLGTCDSRGVGGVGVLVNTSLSINIDSFEQLTTRIGRLRLKRCGSTPALTIFVFYALTSNYDEEEVEAFYMDLKRFYREDHTFFKVTIGDFNAKIGPRRSSEEHHIGTHGSEWNEQVEFRMCFVCGKHFDEQHIAHHEQKCFEDWYKTCDRLGSRFKFRTPIPLLVPSVDGTCDVHRLNEHAAAQVAMAQILRCRNCGAEVSLSVAERHRCTRHQPAIELFF
uniref:C2H2-type domain-containing protein n=1 Tax=Angiostrongylus cantonensis TaxID=6313 RepID=A0A0K0CWS2_ANGCA